MLKQRTNTLTDLEATKPSKRLAGGVDQARKINQPLDGWREGH